MLATVEFLAAIDKFDTEKPYGTFPLAGTDETPTSNVELESKQVELSDIRELDLSLARNGLELHQHTSSIASPRTLANRKSYQSEIQELLYTIIPNVAHITTYESVVRRNYFPDSDFTADMKDPLMVDTPANAAHVDATNKSGPEIIQRYLDRDVLQKYANEDFCFSIINTWRTLVPALEDRPLALCDYETADAQDLVAADRIYPHVEAEIYYIKWNENQKWYWLPKQKTNELLVFVNYSFGKGTHARFCPHLSFDNPHAPPGTPVRESIETRSIVITRVN